MKRARAEPGGAQRVSIDVGGTTFTTTVSTIERSTYLAGMIDLATWEKNPQSTATIFLDRDPEIFSLLLRLMRQFPHVVGLVPHDPRTCASVLAEADYFGFEALLLHVKTTAYYNSREPRMDYPVFAIPRRLPEETYAQFKPRLIAARQAHIAAKDAIDEKFRNKDEAHAVERFDSVYGSIFDALTSGVLPKYFIEPKPLKPPPKKRIVQLLPVDATTWFLVGDTYDTKYGALDDDYSQMIPMAEVLDQPGFVRRVACYALVEDETGERWSEPMVHLTTVDQEEWLSSRPGDGQGIIFGATIEPGSFNNITGGAARRTMLASDWLERGVYNRQGHEDFIACDDYWTHLLVAEEPPEELFFSRAEHRRDYGIHSTPEGQAEQDAIEADIALIQAAEQD